MSGVGWTDSLPRGRLTVLPMRFLTSGSMYSVFPPCEIRLAEQARGKIRFFAGPVASPAVPCYNLCCKRSRVVCATPWTGFENEVLMPTRITCRNECRNRRQTIVRKGFSVPSVVNPKASYTGRNEEIRILCGSI